IRHRCASVVRRCRSKWRGARHTERPHQKSHRVRRISASSSRRESGYPLKLRRRGSDTLTLSALEHFLRGRQRSVMEVLLFLDLVGDCFDLRVFSSPLENELGRKENTE